MASSTPPSFHSNSFAKLESDTHPASKAPSQSTSIINWLGWECHTTSSLIPSYLSLFILFYHIRNHISFVFAFVFRIITCIPSYRPSDHIFGRSIELPSTILPSLISSLQHLVSELKLLNQVILSLHHSLLAFVFPFINQKSIKTVFLFQVLFLHIFVLSVHHTLKPRKRKEKVLFDSFKNRKSQKKSVSFPFCFVSIIENPIKIAILNLFPLFAYPSKKKSS